MSPSSAFADAGSVRHRTERCVATEHDAASPHHIEEIKMNWDRIEGNWKQFKGNVKEQWGKLTDDQLEVIAGKRDHLAGKIQESYGITKDETEKQLAEWQEKMKDHQ
jgi:uncharacterized protein YjbJ (UPF0337 family)